MIKCEKCNGSGEVTLLTSKKPCKNCFGMGFDPTLMNLLIEQAVEKKLETIIPELKKTIEELTKQLTKELQKITLDNPF